MKVLKWTDTTLIAKELNNLYPDVDLLHISSDLIKEKTINLSSFDDDADFVKEEHLKSILWSWMEEQSGIQKIAS